MKDPLSKQIGLEILKKARLLYKAWQQENKEAILDCSLDISRSMMDRLRGFGLEEDRLFAVLEKQEVLWNEIERNLPPESANPFLSDPLNQDAPSLICTPGDAPRLVELIRREMAESLKVWVASAFYSPGVINLLISGFTRFTENGGDLRVLTSTMGNFNRPDYLVHLRDTVPGIQVRVYHPPDIPFDKTPPPFHPKAWLFQRRDGKGALLIGSSNFTEGGFLKNVEWNYYSSGEVNVPRDGQSPFEAALSQFTHHWERESVAVSEDFLKGYRNRWRLPATDRRDIFEPPAAAWDGISGMAENFQAEITPNPAQKEALANLALMRSQGVKKSAVIAATGVGKTHLAAFDYKKSGAKSLLFIAHRENILLKARETFQNVTGDHSFGGLLGAGRETEKDARAVFAMIQTLSRPETLDRYSPSHFEYLVTDEFHHGMAPTYLRVISHFKPRFLLCLTATPERMDGRDVLKLCDYHVACEVRLLDAVDRGWLCPFQYFAVHDETDYEQIVWRGTHYDEEELTRALSNDTRTAIIAANLKKFLPSSGKIKALAFCSSVAHARYTAKKLSEEHGIVSLALTGENPGAERTAALKRLENESDLLQVICTVDIFNEGVDIPRLSHVLLLRPTQSFTVFLQQVGRGLRKAPGKDYLVVIDFVGNFKKSHVAPLALCGYTSIQEFVDNRRVAWKNGGLNAGLPRGCFLDPDTAARRIWDREIRAILKGKVPITDRLKTLYGDIRADLEGNSPSLTDFLDNAYQVDPYLFIRQFGNWLRAKLACEGGLVKKEEALLNTPGEAFLAHLESGLSPVKSYKMVVLSCLLEMEGTTWMVEDIARAFRSFFLDHRDKLFDYEELAGSDDPSTFPLSKVKTKLLQMPLKFLSNTDKDCFVLNRKTGTFALKPEYAPFWNDAFFKSLVADRTKFALTRYFSRKGRGEGTTESL